MINIIQYIGMWFFSRVTEFFEALRNIQLGAFNMLNFLILVLFLRLSWWFFKAWLGLDIGGTADTINTTTDYGTFSITETTTTHKNRWGMTTKYGKAVKVNEKVKGG